MLADQIRAAAMAAPRMKLPDVAAVLWRAYGAGQVNEAEAEELSALIESRKVLPAAAETPRKPVGSRPRSDASLERRRRWAASGRLPPQLAARFTPGEIAVLAVVAAEVCRRGDCRLAVGHIAALAGVSETLVRTALREARHLGLVTVEERAITGWRNDTNVVRLVSEEWRGWLRLAKGRCPPAPGLRWPATSSLGGGCRTAQGTHTDRDKPVSSAPRNPGRAAEGQGRRWVCAT